MMAISAFTGHPEIHVTRTCKQSLFQRFGMTSLTPTLRKSNTLTGFKTNFAATAIPLGRDTKDTQIPKPNLTEDQFIVDTLYNRNNLV